MKDRYLLLKSWIFQVFENNKEMTKKKLIKEFEKDTVPAMAELLKWELRSLKGGKNV